jgi:holo-[acyl-carrier protein] synthase
MTLASGVDLIEIERVRGAIEHHGDRFLQRVFTITELQDCRGRVESLAARFAAKEAAAKALGCGIGDVGWREIEVLGNSNHAPSIQLHGEAARMALALGLLRWSVSLTHTHEYAMAFVVALGE